MSKAYKIPLLIPDLPSADELLPYLRQIDENKWYTNFGPLVCEYELQLAEWLSGLSGRQTHVVTLNSGTTALELGIVALDLPADTKVLIPAFTFPATGTAVLRAGLTPVLTDVDEKSWLLTPEIARGVIEEMDIGMVIPVSTFGVPQDVDAWDQFTVDTGIPVLIDAAAALMNQSSGKTTNCAFSLHATKPLGAGEGGLVASFNQDYIGKIRQLSNFGFDMGGIARPGGMNGKLSEYHSAVGLAQLQRKDRLMQRYRDIYSNYRDRLTSVSGLTFQVRSEETVVFTMCLLFAELGQKSEVESVLVGQGIETRRWYCPPLHRHPAFKSYIVCDPAGKDSLHVSNKISECLLGLPFYSGMSQDEADRVCSEISAVLLRDS